MIRRDVKLDPLWYKDAIFYELRVRSFYDSNGDGIGDFRGLLGKLDYLQSLGVTTLWLLPFYPSPLRDDGYDISDYMSIHPDCGTLADFKAFVREAHQRGLQIVSELVLNHTSEQHAWFQRARRAPSGTKERDYYIWSDNPERYREARIIFQDFELSNWAWDPVAKAYYFHRFYSHQPDLNYDSSAVRREIRRVVDFWLGLGVDGLRLDAVPYLYKREGTNCENLSETHAYLRDLRRHIDIEFEDRMLLAEANQWPEDAASYFADGKECHMAFHFPLMPRMFMAIRMEDRFPFTDIWAQTPPIDPTCQWALFLRNHDELTLEMVTDEERDYMYRAFAQDSRMRVNLGIRRRLAPILGNNRRTMELMYGLLLSLPGTPVIYYGDEIAMGDNVYLGDRDGVRTPMQWSADRNAGFSRANPQRLILPVVIDPEYHYQAVNVEAQDANRHSFLWWIRRLVALRRQFKAFGRGTIEFLRPGNPRVLAYVRAFEAETLFVVANLSRFVQYVELDLSRFKNLIPVELFSQASFPPIGELPYLLTLGPHAFMWFSIQPQAADMHSQTDNYRVPKIEVASIAESLSDAKVRDALRRSLPDFLKRARWFRSKARTIKAAVISEVLTIRDEDSPNRLAFVEVEYTNAEPETYLLPIAIGTGDRAREIQQHWPQHIIAEVSSAFESDAVSEAGILYDATVSPDFGTEMLSLIRQNRQFKRDGSELISSVTHGQEEELWTHHQLEARVLGAEHSNTSIVFGDKVIMKVLRKVETGINPDVQIGRFLTERCHFSHIPPLLGALDYKSPGVEPRSIAILQEFIGNHGDAWELTLRELQYFFEQAATKSRELEPPAASISQLVDLQEPDAQAAEMMSGYIDMARTMGQRVAELHLALLSDSYDRDFKPEPFSGLYQRSVYQSMRNLLGRVMRLLDARAGRLPPLLQRAVADTIAHQGTIASRFETFLTHRFSIVRMRCHGDLHLGQMLYTGKDFLIIDFEGETARPLSERRLKRSSLRDVAGMLRSFQYAAMSEMTNQLRMGRLGSADFTFLEPWARFWDSWASWSFLHGYLSTAHDAPFVPKDRSELVALLDAFVMEKAVYEVGYELDNRPDWLFLPLNGVARLIGLSCVAPNPSSAGEGSSADT